MLEDRKALALHSSLEPAGVCPLTRVADEPASAALAASPYDTRRRSIGGEGLVLPSPAMHRAPTEMKLVSFEQLARLRKARDNLNRVHQIVSSDRFIFRKDCAFLRASPTDCVNHYGSVKHEKRQKLHSKRTAKLVDGGIDQGSLTGPTYIK